MVALVDPGNLLLPGMSGMPSLAQPFPCPACALGREKLRGCVSTGVPQECPVPRGTCLCGSSVGPVPPSPASVGLSGDGWLGQAAVEAGRLPGSCCSCGWVCGCSPPVSAC